MTLPRTPPRTMENPEDVKVLVQKRGQIKAKVTRIFNCLSATENENKRLSLPLLRVHAKNLQVIYQEYNEIHDVIVASVSEENVEAQEEKYIEFEDLYNDTLVKIETMIEIIEKESRPILPVSVPMPVPATSTAANQSSSQPVIIHTQSYRTPLPTFDGRYEAWPRFKAMFQDMMQRSNDSDAVKLYHLENSLKGDAEGVIDLETLQNNNYARAWEILEERFGNQRLIVESHILGLLNMKKVPKKSSKDLRNLVDECTRHVDNLIKLNQRLTGMSQVFVVTLLTRALDDQTRELWEASINQSELPEYEQMIQFLKQRCVILERCETATPSAASKVLNPKTPLSKASHAATAAPEYVCNLCAGQHQNFKCPTFQNMTVEQRVGKLKEAHLCFNCLRKGHRSAACPSDKSCGTCARKHHTLVHFDQREESKIRASAPPNLTEMNPVPLEQAVNASCSSAFRSSKQVFLMTAMVNLLSKSGHIHQVRALLDSGSQINLLSESLVKKLNLPKYPANVPVVGVGGARSQIRHRVAVKMKSNYSDFSTNVDCLVTSKVTGTIPSVNVSVDSWHIPSGIVLADSSFYRQREVEMLIGAEHFFNILKQGQIKLADHLPILYETQFGWAVAGSYEKTKVDSSVCVNLAITDGLEANTQRFFVQEEYAESPMMTSTEERNEEHFQQVYPLNEDERAVVQLPFRESMNQLGSPRERYPALNAQYMVFNDECQSLSHCREVKKEEDPPSRQTYYLPNHCALKPSSSSRKLRVPFNGTAKASKLFLNDVLMTEPSSQNTLFSVVIHLRTYTYYFSVDISKMYRLILVEPSQTRYQRILWRGYPPEALKVLQLLTGTYGTSVASFLAVRSLIQLARDDSENFPEAAKAVLYDSCVDDILTGSDSIESTKKLRRDLLMLNNGFPIQSSCVKSDDVLDGVPKVNQETVVPIQDFGANEVMKALGLLWDSKEGLFLFTKFSELMDDENKTTKRRVVSQIAKYFDPVGHMSTAIFEVSCINTDQIPADTGTQVTVPACSPAPSAFVVPVLNPSVIVETKSYHDPLPTHDIPEEKASESPRSAKAVLEPDITEQPTNVTCSRNTSPTYIKRTRPSISPSVLVDVSKLIDTLIMLSPVIIGAKQQRMWLAGIPWNVNLMSERRQCLIPSYSHRERSTSTTDVGITEGFRYRENPKSLLSLFDEGFSSDTSSIARTALLPVPDDGVNQIDWNKIPMGGSMFASEASFMEDVPYHEQHAAASTCLYFNTPSNGTTAVDCCDLYIERKPRSERSPCESKRQPSKLLVREPPTVVR